MASSLSTPLLARVLDLPPDGHAFNSRPPRLVLGWVTILGWANYLNISPSHPGQLSLLPSAGREMSTSQSAGDALWLGSNGRYGLFHLWINVWVAIKTTDPLLTYATLKHLRDEQLIMKRYTNKASLFYH